MPLGSRTSHFESTDDLLLEAFGRFATTVSEAFTTRVAAARTVPEAVDAIIDVVHDDLQHSTRDHVLTDELSTLSARRPEFRSITEAWMARGRAALERHSPPQTVRWLDALIEGTALHVALDRAPRSRAETRAAVVRLADPGGAR